MSTVLIAFSPLSLKRSIQLSFYDWEGRSEMLETLKTCQKSILKKRLGYALPLFVIRFTVAGLTAKK